MIKKVARAIERSGLVTIEGNKDNVMAKCFLMSKYNKFLKAAGIGTTPISHHAISSSGSVIDSGDKRKLVSPALDDKVDGVVYVGQAARDHLHKAFGLPGRAATEEEVKRAAEEWADAGFKAAVTAHNGVASAVAEKEVPLILT